MTAINNTEDWWESAAKVLPQMQAYAEKMKTPWPAEDAQVAFETGNARQLWWYLNEFWWALPDNATIRVPPFLDMCDLITEFGVFEDDQ